MNSNDKPPTPAGDEFIPSFLDPIFWRHVVGTLALSRQQARIVGLILQRQKAGQV